MYIRAAVRSARSDRETRIQIGGQNMRSPAATSSPLSAIRNREGNTPKDVVGVLGALEAVCELESRLRMAIKSTHPLDSVTWDFHAADRERKALLNIG